MNANSRKGILLLLISISIAIFFGLLLLFNKIYHGFSDLWESMDNNLPVSYELSREDSSLIDSSYWPKTKVGAVFRFKNKMPASFLGVDSQYSLFINHLSIDSNERLNGLIKIEHKNIHASVGYIYSVFENNSLFEFRYYANQLRISKNLYLSFLGDSLVNTISGDSIIIYKFLCSNLSVRYQPGTPVEIFMERKSRFFWANKKVEVEVLFLKRAGSFYMLILTPSSPEILLPDNLLYHIVKGKN